MLETQKALQRFAKHVVSQSRANLTRGKKRASNGLYDSIGYDLKVHKQSFQPVLCNGGIRYVCR